MQKKCLLALLLALAMLLSGCALVTVDNEKDNAQVIVDVNGETVNKAVVHAAVENTIAQNQYYNQLFASYGMSGSYETDEDTVAAQVIETYVNQLVAKQKAIALGLNELTDEEKEAVQTTAQGYYDSFISSVASTYLPGSKLEGDELTAAAVKYAEEHKISTVDGRSTLDDFVQTATEEKLIEKLQDYIVKDVTVSDEEIQADFNTKADEAKASYEADPNAYGTAVNGGSTVYYAPAGYRMVKHILVKVSDEDSAVTTEKQTALNDAKTALDSAAEDADKTALQAAVDAAQAAYDEAVAAGMANAKAKADEIYAQATAEGADFDALIAETNNDPGMPTAGYAIREGFTSFEESFTNAAMALQNVGDVSEPVESTYGYHIIKYVADVQEGPVDLETVKDGISSALLTAKQNDVTDATMAQYVSEATVKTYPERLAH